MRITVIDTSENKICLQCNPSIIRTFHASAEDNTNAIKSAKKKSQKIILDKFLPFTGIMKTVNINILFLMKISLHDCSQTGRFLTHSRILRINT